MLHVKTPVAFVYGAQGIRVSTFTVRHGHFEATNILIAETVNESAFATCIAEVPIADIACSILPLHTSLAMAKVTKPGALVSRSILVRIRTSLCFHAFCLVEALGRAEGLEYFFSCEVASMHTVHITHFNALFDSFSTDKSSDEGLKPDDCP